MIRLGAASVVVLMSIAAASAADPDACRLVTSSEITAALGSPPSNPKPSRPMIDQEYKATGWGCDYQVGKLVLSINAFEFASVATLAKGMAEMMREAKDALDDLKLAPAPGVGDQAVWGASSEGALWVASKGRWAINVTVAGELADPQRLRDPTRRLAALALGRLVP